MPDQPPHLDRYEILNKIGSGGFATVYQARDTRTQREVALKVIEGRHAQEPEFVARFNQEALTAAGLRHPRIVPIYDFGEAEGRLYLAMAFLQGRTLRELLTQRKLLPLNEALPILAQLADALDYLHGQGLVHRDVKPANVMLEREEHDLSVTLTDFGLVRSLETSAALTRTASILGTPAYLSPEQADPSQWGPITPQTDVYALGVLAYETLVGRPPFVGDAVAVINSHANKQPPSPLDLVPGFDPHLAQELTQALAKPPDQRHASAGALVAALRRVAEERRRQASQETQLEQLLAQAQDARQNGQWLIVQDLCVRIMQIDRVHPDALTMMDEAVAEFRRQSAQEAARRQRELRYEQGEQALQARQWQAAIAAFEAVAGEDAAFEDVQDKLKQARDEQQRAQRYDEALAHTQAGRWAEACRACLDTLRGELDYRDGDAARQLLKASDSLLSQHDALAQELEGLQSERDALTGQVQDLQGEINKIKRQAADLDQGRAATIKKLESQRDALAGKVQGLERELDAAKKLAADLDQASQALANYDALLGAFEGQDWEKAVELGEWLAQFAPGLARPQAWLARARAQLERRAARGQDRLTWERDGKEMLRVPAGEFLYGDKKEKVTLPEFWIDQTPVTNAEYKLFLDANPKHPVPFVDADSVRQYNWDRQARSFPQDKGQHPVVLVSWHDAVAYAQWAGKRLPSEQEWEKAARGVDGRVYPWGDDAPTPELCNFGRNEGGTTPVGQYSPQGDTPYGCVDMAGNVWEWTASDYSKDSKVLRGGSWFYDAENLRAALRYYDLTPDGRYTTVGLRCAVEPGG